MAGNEERSHETSKNVAGRYDPWKLLSHPRSGSGLSSPTGAEGGIVSAGVAQVFDDVSNPLSHYGV